MHFGISKNMIFYEFITPWIALNEENFKTYIKIKNNQEKTNSFLKKILIGNILSMSKSMGYVVPEKLNVPFLSKRENFVEIKKGVKLLSLTSSFKINFLIPEYWGIGKFSSRGYGTVVCKNGGKMNDGNSGN